MHSSSRTLGFVESLAIADNVQTLRGANAPAGFERYMQKKLKHCVCVLKRLTPLLVVVAFFSIVNISNAAYIEQSVTVGTTGTTTDGDILPDTAGVYNFYEVVTSITASTTNSLKCGSGGGTTGSYFSPTSSVPNVIYYAGSPTGLGLNNSPTYADCSPSGVYYILAWNSITRDTYYFPFYYSSGYTYNYGEYASSTYASTTAILKINTPAEQQTFLASNGNYNINFSYDLWVASTTITKMGVEVSNNSIGFSYTPLLRDILFSGGGTYSYTLTLPAGYYSWRPYLSNNDGTSKIYFGGDSYYTRSFSIQGTATSSLYDYVVSSTTVPTYTLDQSFGTTSYSFSSTSSFTANDFNLQFVDFGDQCGITQSCVHPVCFEYPNICNRFPMAYAMDFMSFFTMLQNNVVNAPQYKALVYSMTLGSTTYPITMVDFSSSTIGGRLASEVRNWSNIAIWLLFGFWSFGYAGRFLS